MPKNRTPVTEHHALTRVPISTVLAALGLFSVFGSFGICNRWVPAVFCQDRPATGSGSVPVVCDIQQYQADSGKTTVEVVYALEISKNECPEAWSVGQAVLSIRVGFADMADLMIKETRLRKVVTLSETDQRAERITFVNLERFEMHPDSVVVSVGVEDSASGKTGSAVEPVRIRSFGEGFSLSDLYMVGRPQKGGSGRSVFEKHGVFLVPNPSRLYGASGDSSAAWVYFEINHLPSGPGGDLFYSIRITVEDKDGAVIRSQNRDSFRAGAASTSRLEKIPLADLPAGPYTLAVTVLPVGAEQSQTARRKFWIKAAPGLFPFQENVVDREMIRRLIRPIATPEEKKVFSSLTDQGLQEFLVRFWKHRDPDPQTPENEFMVEHLRRFSWAENRFVSGADSDMGRVYIVYGPPVDVQRESSKTEYSKSVEIWYYGIEGTVEFVFVDRLGDGLYRLVHSTQRDEFSNPDWAAEYRP